VHSSNHIARSMFRGLVLACFLFLAVSWAAGTASLRGQIWRDDAGSTSGFVVQLSTFDRTRPEVAEVMPSGQFQFDSVRVGDYQLRVSDSRGNIVYQGFASIDNGNSFLTIRIPEQSRERPVEGTVSVQELQRKIPSKAKKELEKSRKSAQKNDITGAIDHLKKALQIDPDFMEAHNNLGVLYMNANRPEDALAEFRAALKLDPGSAFANSNVAAVLITLKRYPEAEQAARQSLKLDPTRDKAHFALGLSLEAQGRKLDEALGHLLMAAPKLPGAHVIAAEILARKGENNQAATELKEYLEAGQPDNRQAVEAWIRKLQR
jgi:tetratricopeptide (TPR) repeat protein